MPKLDRKSEVYLNLNAVMESCFRFSIIESVFGIHIYFFDFLPVMDRHCVEKKCHVIVFIATYGLPKKTIGKGLQMDLNRTDTSHPFKDEEDE